MSVRRPWAWPLVPLYAAGLAIGDRLRARGSLRERRLEWPVISVGSLSAGGSGKTPVVLALARMLRERGWATDVLSRGYRRAGRGVERVTFNGVAYGSYRAGLGQAKVEDEGLGFADPFGPDPLHGAPLRADELAESSRRFGDEPVLLAARTGAPVWVGAQRWEAGTAAEVEARRELGMEVRGVHLLDDGFQHRGLARSFDLAVVTAEDLHDTLLPAGNLREPARALRRVDAVAVREEEAEDLLPTLRPLLRPSTPVWTLRRTLHFPPPLGVFGAGLRPLAFCAIARPEGFVRSLRSAGCDVVDAVVFPDHHPYRSADVREIAKLARPLHASGLVTTEKDLVKLPGELRGQLEAEIGPLMAVELRTEFVYQSPVLRALENRIEAVTGVRVVRETRVG